MTAKASRRQSKRCTATGSALSQESNLAWTRVTQSKRWCRSGYSTELQVTHRLFLRGFRSKPSIAMFPLAGRLARGTIHTNYFESNIPWYFDTCRTHCQSRDWHLEQSWKSRQAPLDGWGNNGIWSFLMWSCIPELCWQPSIKQLHFALLWTLNQQRLEIRLYSFSINELIIPIFDIIG